MFLLTADHFQPVVESDSDYLLLFLGVNQWSVCVCARVCARLYSACIYLRGDTPKITASQQKQSDQLTANARVPLPTLQTKCVCARARVCVRVYASMLHLRILSAFVVLSTPSLFFRLFPKTTITPTTTSSCQRVLSACCCCLLSPTVAAWVAVSPSGECCW